MDHDRPADRPPDGPRTGTRQGARRAAAVVLPLLLAWFLASALPRLGDYPKPDWAEMGIAAPAYKLAAEGVYGNDLFTGFHGSELRNYEYMPAYPLLVAASFELFGLGLFQARIVSVVCGVLVILLTWALGSRLHGAIVGLAAAGFLTVVQLGPAGERSGITLIDFARTIRYDLLVPVFTLAACLLFLGAIREGSGGAAADDDPDGGAGGRSRIAFLGAGALVGMATLSHLYGAFTLPVFAAMLWWRDGRRGWHAPWLLGGWLVAVSPWILYVLQDVPDFVGQMSRHEGRFDVFSPAFYWDNVRRETARYAAWVGGFPEGLLRPRLGIWIMVIGVAASWPILWRRQRTGQPLAARFTLVALPLLALQFALLLSLKRHVYTLMLLPFIAIQVAVTAQAGWTAVRASGKRALRALVALVMVLAVAEGGLGVSRMLVQARAVTPYRRIAATLDDAIEEDGAVILVSQPFWMALADHRTRSANLPFVQTAGAPFAHEIDAANIDVPDRAKVADDASPAPRGPASTGETSSREALFARALREIDFDYVVLERVWIEHPAPDSSGHANPRSSRLWAELGRHIRKECPQIVATVEDASYGVVVVHACGSEPR